MNRPVYIYHDEFQAGFDYLSQMFQPPSASITLIQKCSLLTRNTSTLIRGKSGTGKTLLIRLFARLFFRMPDSDAADFGQVTCSQDQTATDALFEYDIGQLMKGNEIIIPRKVIESRLKHINEATRANSVFYNRLLSLLAEHKLIVRDQTFHSRSFNCQMDANPNDSGATDVPQAFIERIDYSYHMPLLDCGGHFDMLRMLETAEGFQWDSKVDSIPSVLTSPQMEELWLDVAKVDIPVKMKLFAALLSSYLQGCIVADRSLIATDMPLDCFSCKHRAEACAKIKDVPGTRFLKSTLKLAQARAWLRMADEISVEDLLYGLPYTLGHRLKIREDHLNLYENAEEWIMKDLYSGCIRGKIPRWLEAVDSLVENDNFETRDESSNVDDPAVARLLSSMKNRVYINPN